MRIFCILVIIMFCSCSSKGSEQIVEIEVLPSNPRDSLNQDLSENNVHFLGFYGFSLIIPGSGVIEKSVCFRHIETKIVNNGEHRLYNKELEKVKSRNMIFMRRYNQQLKTYLEKSGLSDCPEGENWENAFNDFDSYIEDKVQSPVSGLKMGIEKVPSFTIVLENVNFIDEISIKACEMFSNNGIDRPIEFTIERSSQINGKWIRESLAVLYCTVGKSKLKLLK